MLIDSNCALLLVTQTNAMLVSRRIQIITIIRDLNTQPSTSTSSMSGSGLYSVHAKTYSQSDFKEVSENSISKRTRRDGLEGLGKAKGLPGSSTVMVRFYIEPD